jgi:excisionase family DNA binding protein
LPRFQHLRPPKNSPLLPEKIAFPHNLRNVQALLTLAEAAKILKVSKTKLYHERKAGRINVVTIGVRCVRVTEAEVKRYVRAAGLNSRPGRMTPKPLDQAEDARPAVEATR